MCIDCKKPRCVYASAALSCDERKHLKHAIHSRVNTCGCQLFPPGSSQHDAVICRQALTCKHLSITVSVFRFHQNAYLNTHNAIYYVIIFHQFVGFAAVQRRCSHYDEFLQNLRTEYAIVRPICFLCHSEGKCPATWGACNVAAKSSKSNQTMLFCVCDWGAHGGSALLLISS